MRPTLIASVFVAGFVGGLLAAAQKPEAPGLPAERVTGIGGVFFKARDPKALSAWYREKLGVAVGDGGAYALFEWREQEDTGRVGMTVWSLFRSVSGEIVGVAAAGGPGRGLMLTGIRPR